MPQVTRSRSCLYWRCQPGPPPPRRRCKGGATMTGCDQTSGGQAAVLAKVASITKQIEGCRATQCLNVLEQSTLRTQLRTSGWQSGSRAEE